MGSPMQASPYSAPSMASGLTPAGRRWTGSLILTHVPKGGPLLAQPCALAGPSVGEGLRP